MKKLLLLLIIGFVVFVAFYHMRLFVWDPLATVTRDGVKDTDARAMINFANDVLLEDNEGGRLRLYLVQHTQSGPVVPAHLDCLGSVACLTDADRATGTLIPSHGSAGTFTVGDRNSGFTDENGQLVAVRLH